LKLRQFARGGALGIATLVVEKGAAFLLIVILARTLPPETYGIYSFVVAYLTLFQVLADLGLEPVLVHRLAASESEREEILSAGLGLRLGLALASGSLAIVLAPWASGEGMSILPVVGLGAAGMLFLAQPGFRALLRAELRLGAVLTVASATAATMLALVFLAVWRGGGLEAVLVAYAVAVWAGLALAAVLVRRDLRFCPRVQLAIWRGLLAESWPVGLNLFVLMLGLRAAALVLMREAGPVAVGYYSSAARLGEATNLIGEGVLLVVFPVLARLGAGRAEQMARLSRLVTKGLTASLCLVALVVGAVAEELMAAVFGTAFAAAGVPLAILLWAAPLAAVGSLYANLLIVAGRQRVLLVVNAVVAVVLIGLQLALVPRLGIEGAAIGVVAGSFCGHLLLAAAAPTRSWVGPSFRAMLPILASALASLMAVSAFADGMEQALWLVLIFPTVLFATGLLSAGDIVELRRLLGASPGKVEG
jgi:O-antigen/teichoic acid export membrane protein